jgi:methyltransferase-like protein
MKFKSIEYTTENIAYPIKFEIFTFNFFEREDQFLQTVYADPKHLIYLRDLTYKKVINKSRYGRVLLVKNFKNGRHYALKYFHKWKIAEWE